MNNSNPYLEGDNYTYPNYAEWAAGTRTISLAAPTAVSKDVRLVFTSGGAGTGEAATATSSGMVASHTSSVQASTQSTSSTSSSGALSTGTEKATSSAAKRPISLAAVALALAFLSAL